MSTQLAQRPHGAAGEAMRPIDLDVTLFHEKYDREPYLLPHHMLDHPLLRLPRLIELGRQMPPEFVEYYAGNVPVSIDYHRTPRNGLSIEETIRRIEECCSWMVLKRVEQVPEYKELLLGCLREVIPLAEQRTPGLHTYAGAIFVSSPGAVTPYHMDHEHNFLLHIHGTKRVHVLNVNDRSVVAEEELERYFTGDQINRNLTFQPEFEAKEWRFDLSPGWALHIPSCYPHWVKNGAEYSISLSCAYYSSVTDRQESVFTINHWLRRAGWRPTAYGRRPWLDSAKLKAYRGLGRLQRLVRGQWNA